MARTLNKYVTYSDGERRPTATVVLGFVDHPPESVKLGYRFFRTWTYIPEPLQCHRCLRFGQVQAKCRAATARVPEMCWRP